MVLRHRGEVAVHVRMWRRLARRALALAGRRPWLAFLIFRWVFAMGNSSLGRPVGRRRNTSAAWPRDIPPHRRAVQHVDYRNPAAPPQFAAVAAERADAVSVAATPRYRSAAACRFGERTVYRRERRRRSVITREIAAASAKRVLPVPRGVPHIVSRGGAAGSSETFRTEERRGRIGVPSSRTAEAFRAGRL